MADEQGARRSGIVTLLFTDLVSSTELLDRLGDEDFERLRRIHFQLLREAVAASGGEEVKNLGDGLMVVFPSALDAIGCAVAMQQAVALHNAEPDVAPIAVRVGLHAGEPIVEEDDYFGTPVVVAKRLCDQASGGQILVSDLVAALVGGRRQFSFRETGAMELKGIGDPMPTREVVWREDEVAATAVAVPPPPPPVGAPAAASPPLPPLPPQVEAHPPTAGDAGGRARWKRIGIGALAVIGALSLLGAILGGGDDQDAATTTTVGTGAAPPASVGGRPLGVVELPDTRDLLPDQARTFADGRDPDADGFLLVGLANLVAADGTEELPLALREGEVVTIAAESERARVEPFLELLRPDGSLATFDLDTAGAGKPAIYRWEVPESGRYTVRVSTLTRSLGPVTVLARSEPVVNPAGEPDSFAAAVELGPQRPEAAWRWDTGESGQVAVRVQPHPEHPMRAEVTLVDGQGERMVMAADELLDGVQVVDLPHGGEWELHLVPTGGVDTGVVDLQVWLTSADRPEPEKMM